MLCVKDLAIFTWKVLSIARTALQTQSKDTTAVSLMLSDRLLLSVSAASSFVCFSSSMCGLLHLIPSLNESFALS